ncbi:MAG: sugar phosphate isomerase/epimerase [Pirellulales bacterium]|nr:sugar phosphate isomerase/epimerase [Pirellulales bacterium]
MKTHVNRRDFLATSALATAGVLATGSLSATAATTETPTTPAREATLHKAMIGPPKEAVLRSWQAAGIRGMETVGTQAWQKSPVDAAKDHLTAEQLGMRIHSVLFGWANVNDKDSGKVARDIENTKTALRAAQGYGADTLLWVPCKISDMPMPKPWDFDIKFDEKTGHVTQVAAGDNAPYEKYIEAYNASTDASRKAIEKLIPVAQETGVVIAIENVWNNLWVTPATFANFIGSFNSHWVQAYYDVANHVRYAPPEEWIKALGSLIVKLHIKDFRLDRNNANGGHFVNIRDGSVNWPSVLAELDKIGYHGWATLEGSGRMPLEERVKRLDLIVDGK